MKHGLKYFLHPNVVLHEKRSFSSCNIFPPRMLKSSASAISLLHKSKIYCVNKSSGDRNAARVFFFFSFLRQMAEEERQLEFWS